MGVPNFAAMPLSFGLAYGFSGGEKEIDGNMIMDSQAINRTFELLNILPDTPESKIAEAVATAFEGTLWTAAIGPLTKTFKLLKIMFLHISINKLQFRLVVLLQQWKQ